MSTVFPASWSDQTREEILAPWCPRCEAPLILHQPDRELPYRLLAVCEACKGWYVSDPDGLLLTPIPVADERRRRRRRPLD